MSPPFVPLRSRILSSALVLALLSALVVAVPAGASDTVEVEVAAGATVVPDRYIVTLKPDVDPQAVVDELANRGTKVEQVYETLTKGFAADLDRRALQRLQRDPRVIAIEQDVVIELAASTAQEPVPSWGLDRIDQRERPLDGQFRYDWTGDGVPIYIVDTGVRSTHTDFGGRVLPGFSAFGDDNTEDCHGHGTHVAGTAAGAAFGVAKQASVVPVRVMRCDGGGAGSDILAGIDWILDNHPRGTPGVVNFSVVTGRWATLDTRIQRLHDAGLVVAAGAGNDGGDACMRSPARSEYAVTAGATTSSDSRWSSSNTGVCVDVFAPGASITSTWRSSNTATRSMSGTSMASPHIAGAAAKIYGANPSLSAAQVGLAITSNATSGVISNVGSGSPNLLLFTDPTVTPTEPAPEPEPEPEPEPQPEPEPEPEPDLQPGYEHDPATTPSTNDANRSRGWSHVNVVTSSDVDAVLQFVQPRSFTACFEYRVGGSAPTKTRSNFNTLIGDGLWDYVCVGGAAQAGPVERTVVTGGEELEIRLVFGAEAKERFWWTEVVEAATVLDATETGTAPEPESNTAPSTDERDAVRDDEQPRRQGAATAPGRTRVKGGEVVSPEGPGRVSDQDRRAHVGGFASRWVRGEAISRVVSVPRRLSIW